MNFKILLFTFLIILSTFAFGKTNILVFQVKNDVYAYDVASKNKSIVKLNNDNEVVQKFGVCKNNAIFFILKESNSQLKFSQKLKAGLLIKKLFIPKYSAKINKVAFSPNGSLVCIKTKESNSTTINLFKWNKPKKIFEKKYLSSNQEKLGNSLIFSADSNSLFWTKINSSTYTVSIKKLDITKKSISTLADVKTSKGFSNIIVPIWLYRHGDDLFIKNIPNYGQKPTFRYITKNNQQHIINSRNFLSELSIPFVNKNGVWFLKGTKKIFLFGYIDKQMGNPTQWKMSKLNDYIAVLSAKKTYIRNIKGQEKIIVFDGFINNMSWLMY